MEDFSLSGHFHPVKQGSSWLLWSRQKLRELVSSRCLLRYHPDEHLQKCDSCERKGV